MQGVKQRRRISICGLPVLLIMIAFFLMGCETGINQPATSTDDSQAVTGTDPKDNEMTATPQAKGPEETLITIEKSSWINAYKDYIRNVDPYGSYELIYLNNDDVPEVIYQSNATSEARTIVLYSYCEDETGGYVFSGYVGFDCNAPRYIPREGYIVCQSRDYRDMDTDYICHLSCGKIHRLFKGTTFKEKGSYLITAVTEEFGTEEFSSLSKYNSLMKDVFNRFLELVECGDGSYSTEDELWEAMENTPDEVSCIYVITGEPAIVPDAVPEQ